MSVDNVFSLIREHEVKFVDLRFTDTKGKEQHVSIPSHQIDDAPNRKSFLWIADPKL